MLRKDLRPNTAPWVIGKIVLRALYFGYLRMSVDGEANVPSEGPTLLVCNHRSNLDPFAIGIACHREVDFLAKEEIFRVPVLAYFVRQWGAIPLDRRATDSQAMRAAIRVLRQGKILGIFPEGRRSKTGELQPFHTGAAKIALRLKLPVIPVAITGTELALPPGAWLPRPHSVRLRFGRPFELSPSAVSAPNDDILQEASEEIRGRVAALLQR